MDSKKLQQLQQANSHLAPQKKLPLGYHQNLDDYNDITLAQAYNNSYAAQYQQSMRGANFNALNFVGSSPYTEQSPSSSGGFGTSSNTLSPQDNHEYLMRLSNSNQNPFLQQAQYPTNDQLYQTPREIRPYQIKGQPMNAMAQCTSPVSALQDQYQQLQKARVQAQMKTQNEAVAQQQRTFALRQALNPPVPVNLSASPSMLSNIQMQSQQQPIVQAPLRNAPPSTLNLNNQYQPAFNNSPANKQIYQHYQQNNGINSNYNTSSGVECNDVHHGIKPTSPVYIQQNHPGHVVNQACQTQFTANQQQQLQLQQKQSPLNSEDSLSSPSKNNSSITERRKSTGSNQTIKSPISKRPLAAPVTLSGWLYKQGSDGLKVWRKRWFVLAEYCLYYYKGPEEDKVLGSLTLPSYKISPCSSDDKIYRKFAFKCEHTNMRTYWLAAENQEQMSQWIRGLIAAAMMQNNELISQSNDPNKFEKFNEINKNSSGAMAQQQVYKDTAENSGFSQPLYANAPPKPRRITEGGYSSPSPEHSNENSRSDQGRFSQGYVTSPNLQPTRQHRSHHAIYNTKTGNVMSSLIPPQTLINNNNLSPQQINEMNLRAIQSMKLASDEIYSERDKNLEIPYLNAERRTPDAYGRSKHNKFFTSDYEDINLLNPNEQYQTYPGHVVASYTRPISPRRYNQQLLESQALAMQQSNVPYPRTKSQQSIARPRSADFLEYDSNIKPDRDVIHKNEMIRAPRPKSSLDINRSQDNYYYSEASYAEKMRRSALYLQKSPSTMNQKNVSLGSKYPENPYEKQKYLNEMALQNNTNSKYYNEEDSRNFTDMQQNETFLRSASARLPKKHNAEFSGDDALIDGERKREESMKRLLEWKQRMLQSPLTRKGIQQNGSQSYLRLGSNPNFQMPNHEIQKSRSQVNNAIGYSSYSSDDEASIAVQNIHNLPNNNLIVKPESYNLIDQFYGNDIEQKYSTIPKAVFNKNNDDLTRSYTNLNNYIGSDGGYLNHKATIDLLERETSSQIKNMDVSAGDLLSRTHEELILLLIQLRRQNSKTARAIEQCCTDIHKIQNRIRLVDGLTREEKIQRLDQLKQHLLDLEKQYEKSKPLVNLVDNMVKLGSLYRNNETNKSSYSIKNNTEQENINTNFVLNDRHEFNKKIEENRLVKEEKKQWDRLSPNHLELQSKVDELYKLDQMLQEESGTLQNLQKDKEEIERALTGIRSRLQGSDGPLLAVEAAKKQQQLLEQELSRVHKLLAQNSKKLEQTVAGNSILEQELIVLRQKLQTSQSDQRSRLSSSITTTSGYTKVSSTTTANLEAELKRVQKLVGDMQRQRKELSHTVKQLTENSNRLYQDINRDYSLITNSTYGKKRTHSSSWTETDLDSMRSFEQTADEHIDTSLPLYVDTANAKDNYMNHSDRLNGSTYDDESEDGINYSETNPFINALNNEKQEIKTVRIVKRESERRHRDRERTTNSTVSNKQNLGQVVEENNKSNKDLDLIYTSKISTDGNDRKHRSLANSANQKTENSNGKRYSDYSQDNSFPVSHSDKNSNIFSNYGYNDNYSKSVKFSSGINNENIDVNNLTALKKQTDSMQSLNKSISELTPVFHSEAARQIMNEMSAGSASEDNNTAIEKVHSRTQQHKHKRITPREKRRHNTAPHNVNQLAMERIHSANEANKNGANFRARDDLDMEVALRPRINAPDVVRSALGQNEKISENTIDRLFGAPSKILIPERYIPEKAPELSPTEKKRRQEKVEAIKKMLAENPDPTTQVSNATAEEKKQREHLLQLNQILAQQVMQMSKIVAERAIAALPSEIAKLNLEMAEEDREYSSSPPIDSLPHYQHRDNFYA